MKMEIKVMECSLVRPVEETPQKRLWVSSLDLLVAPIHVSTVYFYECNGCPRFFEPEALKEGLSKALVPFYPVAGRLGRDGDGRVEINCNGEGVLFVYAHSNFELRDFGDLSTSSLVKQLIPFVDRSGGDSSYPLIAFQVTRLKCGSVSVGVGVHHTLADGTCAINFINTWSDMVRGASIDNNNMSSPKPYIDRTVLRARDPPTPLFHHKEYTKYVNLINTHACHDTTQTNTSVLKLSLDQLNTLKAKSRFSTYVILAAHIWRCLSKSRNLPHDQSTTLYIPTDGRSRLDPPLPPSYIGNVLFTNTLTLNAGDVVSQPIGDIASKIQESITKMSGEYLRSAIDFLEMQSDVTAFRRGASTFASPNVNVNSWLRLPIYDADFGWGRPIYMGPSTAAFEGNIYVIPSPKKDGGLSVVLSLKPSQMELFHKYLYQF